MITVYIIIIIITIIRGGSMWPEYSGQEHCSLDDVIWNQNLHISNQAAQLLYKVPTRTHLPAQSGAKICCQS